ncbi:MAG: AraC family transcriptional regulator [Acidobacteria bacterium]|nr:MAG: AraC family transcriptional regulator [Acidobacteriota bacterium]REK07385.1 MAG: AraC family transcriptional regulator [Acidobacteriota bacterium]
MVDVRDAPSALYEQLPPDPRLVGWVAYVWRFRAGGTPCRSSPPSFHRIPPESGMTLTLLPQAAPEADVAVVLSGPHRRSIEVPSRPGETIAGVRFWPATLSPWLELPVAELLETMAPARVLAPRIAASLQPRARAILSSATDRPEEMVRRFGDALAPFLPAPHEIDLPIYRAAMALLGAGGEPPSIADLAHRAGLSPRQFRRRFRAAVGLSPREVRRNQRVRVTLERAVDHEASGWAELAVEQGFADQAHFCREFRESTGRSPELYRREIAHIAHRGLGVAAPGEQGVAELFKTRPRARR